MLNSIILLGGLVSAFGLGAINPNQEKQDNVNFRLENYKSVQYNDADYEITLSADELNNYTWENLYNAVSSNIDTYIDNLVYDSNTYSAYGDEEGAYIYEFEVESDNYAYIYFINDAETYNGYNSTEYLDYVFAYMHPSQGRMPFNTNLTIISFSGVYADVKQAIELDIQANQSNINDGIFETLTDSVVAFVGSLGSGILSMTNIFYDSVNNQLTAIGLLSVIVVAVSLTYFLFRLIIGLIRMRG